MLKTLANSERTPAFILNWLAYDRDRWVRYWVAFNPNTPPKTLDRLSYEEYWGFVRVLLKIQTPHQKL